MWMGTREVYHPIAVPNLTTSSTSSMLCGHITQPNAAKEPPLGKCLVTVEIVSIARVHDSGKPPLIRSWSEGRRLSREMEISRPQYAKQRARAVSLARPYVCIH